MHMYFRILLKSIRLGSQLKGKGKAESQGTRGKGQRKDFTFAMDNSKFAPNYEGTLLICRVTRLKVKGARDKEKGERLKVDIFQKANAVDRPRLLHKFLIGSHEYGLQFMGNSQIRGIVKRHFILLHPGKTCPIHGVAQL